MNKVLIVEDDPQIIDLIQIHLLDLGCEVDKAMSGEDGLVFLAANSYDLVVLDLMLPGIDGLEVCREVRKSDDQTQIMMLTAKAEEIDKVLGFEMGADYYMTKPFSVREFTAQVKAILRRKKQSGAAKEASASGEMLSFPDLTIDVAKRKVIVRGERKALTPKEYDLLELLAKNPGQSFSREKLLNLIWGYEFSGYDHTVNSHVNRLRNKIEADSDQPSYILTAWGVGYRFNDEL